MNTKTRLIQYLNYKGVTKSKFFISTDIKRGFLDADKMSGAVSDDHIAKIIANYGDLNLYWLITGVGDMIKGDSVIFFPPKPPQVPPEPTIIYKSDPKDAEIIELQRRQIAMLDRQVEMSDKQIRMLEEKIKETDHHFTDARSGDPATVAEPPLTPRRATKVDI